MTIGRTVSLVDQSHNGTAGNLPENHIFSGEDQFFQQKDGMVMEDDFHQSLATYSWRNLRNRLLIRLNTRHRCGSDM
jgi:hypothetical protein